MKCFALGIGLALLLTSPTSVKASVKNYNFDASWKFCLGDDSLASAAKYNDAKWRTLCLPHDWSIPGWSLSSEGES